jgi:hypothetical protein
MYWDKIEFPINPIIDSAITSDMQLLIDRGVMSRTRANLPRIVGDLGLVYILTQYRMLQALEATQPGVWAIGQAGDARYSPADIETSRRSLMVELYEALPVPSPDTPGQSRQRWSEFDHLQQVVETVRLP